MPRTDLAASPVSPRPPMFRSLGIATSGLSAQRARMDVIAQNIANADVTRTETGGPYRRRVVDLATAGERFTNAFDDANALLPAEVAQVAAVAALPGRVDAAITPDLNGVSIVGVRTDDSEGPRVYEPGHPDADADGYVIYPNVRVTDEMVDLMDARRLFEANATAFQVARAMLRRSLDL